MDQSRRSYFQLLLVAVTGLIFNLLSALFPTPIPQAEQRPNQLVITGSTAETTAVDLFFDFGYGISPDQMARQQLVGSADSPTTLTFPLPAGDLARLRFDPTENSQISYWENAEIRASDGRVLHQFAPSDFVAANQIDSLALEGGKLKVTPSPGAYDSGLLVRLPHPIRLPVDSVESRPRQDVLLGTQRLIAVLLGFAGILLTVVVLERNKTIGAAKPSAPSRRIETLVLLYAALGILFFRRPSLFIAPQMFVEDGVIFFQQQWTLGWKAILLPYSGYLHLIPRLTAWGASFFPVSLTPLLFLVVAILAVLATVLKAASPRAGLPFPYWSALAVLCLPNGDEVTAFLTNVHWWAGVILFLVGLSAAARTRGEWTRDLLAVVLAGLSGPWAVLCAPLFAFRLWQRRTWAQAALFVALLVVAGIQLHFNQAGVPALTSDFLANHALHSVAGLGYRLGGQLVGYLPHYYWSFWLAADPRVPIFAWEIWAFVGWLLLLVALPVSRIYRETRYIFIAFAVLMAALTVLRTNGWEYMLFDLPIDQRYVFIPLLLTYWLLIMAVDNSGWQRWGTLVFLALVLVRNTDNFRMPPVVDAHWPKYAPQLERGEAVTIPIFPVGWKIEVAAKHR